MTATAALPADADDPATDFRVRCFALLMVAAALAAALAVAFPDAGLWWLVFMPAYVLWVVSDLRVRRVTGGTFAVNLVVSLLPVIGLLLYLLLTRGPVGALQWIVFVAALCVPAGLAAMLAWGITRFVSGGHW